MLHDDLLAEDIFDEQASTKEVFDKQTSLIAESASELAKECSEINEKYAPELERKGNGRLSQKCEIYWHNPPLGEEECSAEDLARACLAASFDKEENPSDFVEEKRRELEALREASKPYLSLEDDDDEYY